MPAIELPNNWQPRRYQFKLWNALQNEGKRRAIEIAHRRWGKDDVILHHTAIEAHKRVATYWHCLPEYAQARKAIWAAVNPHTGKRRIDEAFPLELRDSTNDQEMFIRFKNGSTWQVIGSDRYNSLVGAGVAGVVFSEWALCNPSAWAYISPMMRENNGWAVFITTPRGRNHAYSMFNAARANPDWFAELSSISDTRALPPDVLNEIRQTDYIDLFGEDLGSAQFEQEYHCSFEAAIPGAYYGREITAAERAGRITSVPIDPDYPVHTAWDLGKGDNMAIWCFQIIGSQIRVVDYLSGQASYIPDYCALLNARGYHGHDIVPHDAKVAEIGTGRTRVETMIEHKRKPRLCADHRVDDGISAVRHTLPLCWFDSEKTEAGLSALRAYQREWDDDKKTFKLTPRHDWASHGADAFRYLAMGWRTVPEAEKPKDPLAELLRPKTIAEVMDEFERRNREDD